MLDFILTSTRAEETAAHDAEVSAQHAYEDSMTGLKTTEGTLQGSLEATKLSIAQKEMDLDSKRKEHAASSKEKAALEKYLVEIKPGCDFITSNLAERKANRIDETAALNQAKSLLEGSPAYTEAEAAKHQASLGKCRELCNEVTEEHVKCKACLVDTSVPGYCAGHPGTTGCD